MRTSGSVLTDDMEIVAYANVVVVGENRSTQADVDGKFSIEVDGYDSVLHFSKVGFYYEEMTVAEFNRTGYVNLGFSTENLANVNVTNNAKSDYTGLIVLGVLVATGIALASGSKTKQTA